MKEVQTIKFTWTEINRLFEKMFKQILGKTIKCDAVVDDHENWGIRFVDYQMPIEEIKTVCAYVKPNSKERKEAMPYDEVDCVNDFGYDMVMKMLKVHLGVKWKTVLATDKGLYLIECESLNT